MAVNIQNTNLRISAGFAKQFPTDPMKQVAFSGRSNVGKSSLINTILGRKSLARVSSMPGKTITINFYDVDKKLFLVDLPGYGYAKRQFDNKEQWSSLTDGYFTKNPNIDLLAAVIQLVDCKVGITNDDAMMLDYLSQMGIPFVIAATKVDKLNKTDRAKALQRIASHPLLDADTVIIPFSSHTGEGKAELWKEILKFTDL